MSNIEDRLRKQKKEQADARTEEMLKKGDEYFSLIVENTVSDIKRLPESTFVKNFLPYFCGEEDTTKESNTIAIWIAIAGSITSKVHVVDKNDEILFTVPPINDTSIFDVNNKNQAQGFKNIVLNYRLYSNQTPMSAQNYLARTIDSRIEKLRTESVMFNENETTWKNIFARYGKGPSVKAVDVKKQSLLDDDELVYD